MMRMLLVLFLSLLSLGVYGQEVFIKLEAQEHCLWEMLIRLQLMTNTLFFITPQDLLAIGVSRSVFKSQTRCD